VDRFVAPSPPPANWPMKPRRGRNAPVRKMKAAAMRKRSPESCARTAIAATLTHLRVTGDGARTAKQIAAKIAVLFEQGAVVNLQAASARGLVAQLGLTVADESARLALALLVDGPLSGFYTVAKPHAPARLLLGDLLAAAVAQTPAARVKLPLALASGITADDRTTPPSVSVETPPCRGVLAPRIDGTHAVANKASASPRNPELARAVLPPGAQVARTFELCVAAWPVSPAWGQAPLADLARSLVPDDLYEGQRQVQRGLKSLVRAGILREHGAGVVLAWQPARAESGPLVAALMSWHGGVQQIDPARQRADLAAACVTEDRAREALLSAREALDDQEARARAALRAASREAAMRREAMRREAHLERWCRLCKIAKASRQARAENAKAREEAYRQADMAAAEALAHIEPVEGAPVDDPVLFAALHYALAGDLCRRDPRPPPWMAPFQAQRREAQSAYARTLNGARAPIWECLRENQAQRALRQQEIAECRQAVSEAVTSRKATASLQTSDAMLACLERWGIDARTLTRADANKLGKQLYYWIVKRRQDGLAPLGPRERLDILCAAGVPRARVESWAVNGDAQVEAVARAIRRGVNPVGLLAIFEAARATPAIELTAEPGQSIDDLDEAAALFWDADMIAANGDALDDAGWADMLDEPELLRVDLSHWAGASAVP